MDMDVLLRPFVKKKMQELSQTVLDEELSVDNEVNLEYQWNDSSKSRKSSRKSKSKKRVSSLERDSSSSDEDSLKKIRRIKKDSKKSSRKKSRVSGKKEKSRKKDREKKKHRVKNSSCSSINDSNSDIESSDERGSSRKKNSFYADYEKVKRMEKNSNGGCSGKSEDRNRKNSYLDGEDDEFDGGGGGKKRGSVGNRDCVGDKLDLNELPRRSDVYIRRSKASLKEEKQRKRSSRSSRSRSESVESSKRRKKSSFRHKQETSGERLKGSKMEKRKRKKYRRSDDSRSSSRSYNEGVSDENFADRSQVKTYILPQFNTKLFSNINPPSTTNSNSKPISANPIFSQYTESNKTIKLNVIGKTTTKLVEYNKSSNNSGAKSQNVDSNSTPAAAAVSTNWDSSSKGADSNAAVSASSSHSIDHYVKMCRQIAKDEKLQSTDSNNDNTQSMTTPSLSSNVAMNGEFIVKPVNRIMQMNNFSPAGYSYDQGGLNFNNTNLINARQLSSYNSVQPFVAFPVGSGEEHRAHNEKIACGKISERDPKSLLVYSLPQPSYSSRYKENGAKSSKQKFGGDVEKMKRDRAELTKQLKRNPQDTNAMIKLHQLEKALFEYNENAEKSKYAPAQPGKFTGTTKVQCLTQKQLEGDDPSNQAWARKDIFKRTNKLNDTTAGPGKRLLEKMGWKPGCALGKSGKGCIEPIDLSFNLDRKGLCGKDEEIGVGPVYNALTGLQGRHPVSVLEEACRCRSWGSPYYELVSESGPAHKRIFHYKVRVNNVDYIPHSGSCSKKQAKTDAAAGALFALGLS